MKISISQKIDTQAKHKNNEVTFISEKLKSYFNDKFYGEDIQNYIIGFTCVLPPEGYEHLFPKKKPLYVDDKTVTNKYTGEKERFYKLFINEIYLNNEEYEDFISNSNIESKKLLVKKILESLDDLHKLPKKVVDFNLNKFRSDLKEFFKKENLI